MLSTMSRLTLCECFARDGLQHEPAFVPTAVKRALVERFAAIGFPRVEVTSYSNPGVVPQFSDASELLKSIARRANTYYKATCANPKAVQRALSDLDAGHGANEISLLVSATESHSRKNLKRSRAEQWSNIGEMVRIACGRFRLVGTVSVAFGCPFEGKVDGGSVVEDVARFVQLGVTHVAIGDTTGMATPAKVRYGGGHTGNVCTEDLVGLFESMGIATGIDLDQLLATAEFCEQALGRELHGRVTRSGLNPVR